MMKFFVGFSCSMIFFALIAWLSGFDFDERNFAVGYSTLVVVIISCLVGSIFNTFNE